MLTILLALGALGSGSYASEPDHYSLYNVPLADSREQLNQMVNEHLAQALGDRILVGCDERNLYEQLRGQFNSQFKGKLAKSIVKKGVLDHIYIAPKESIYKKFLFFKRPMYWVAKIFLNPMASIIRVGDVRLGDDKLEHMWSWGFRYFKRHYLWGEDLQDILSGGFKSENGFWGKRATGVFAYGDLAANFQGMRFWNHLLQRGEDVLGENLGPYLECAEGIRWVQVKEIDMGDYIDHSFDESINCSLFGNQRVLARVQRELGKLSERDGVEYTCPMRGEDVLGPLRDKYGWGLASELLNFQGHNTVKGHQVFLKGHKENQKGR